MAAAGSLGLAARQIWRELCDKTTAHGVSNTANAQGPYKKVFWSVMMMAALGMLGFHIATISTQFFSYPITVSIQLMHEQELIFPAVTLCNMNPVRKSLWEVASADPGDTAAGRRRIRSLSGCGPGWLGPHGSRCFRVLGTAIDFPAAVNACRTDGAHVVVLNNQTRLDDMAAVGVLVLPSTLWLGAVMAWTWADGVPLQDTYISEGHNYSNWDVAQTPQDGDHCAATTHAATWRIVSCEETYGYICEMQGDANNSCSAGWYHHGNSCYNITTDAETHAGAAQSCADAGSQQLVVEDQVEQDFIWNITSSSNETFWLGLTMNLHWLDRSTGNVTLWQANYPKVHTTGTCVISLNHGNVWQTSDCENVENVVCEKDQGPIDVESQSTAAWPNQSSTTPSYLSATAERADATTETPSPGDSTSTAPITNAPSSKCCCQCCYYDSVGLASSCSSCGEGCLSGLAFTGNSSTQSGDSSLATAVASIEGSQYPERKQTTEDFQEMEAVTETLSDLPVADKAKLGYSAGDLILDCEYAGSECTLSDFRQFYNPIHGNCFIFNAGWNASDETRLCYKTGRRHGLQLILNIDQDDYLRATGDTAGVRVVVHPQGQLPFPEDEGITVSPGQATFVGFRQLLLKRLSKPYGECVDTTDTNVSRNAYQAEFPVGYRETACAKTCYQRNVIEQCHCADPYYPRSEEAFGRKVTTCRASNITQDDCRYNITKQFERNELECDCPDSCKEVAFEISASTALWPSDVQKSDLIAKFAPRLPALFLDPTDPEKYQRNMLKVGLFYEEFNFESLDEIPAYHDGNYLSDMGGTMGLWLGCSVLTIAEFIELCIDLSALVCTRCRPGGCLNRVGDTTGGAPKRMTSKGGRPATPLGAPSAVTPPPPYSQYAGDNTDWDSPESLAALQRRMKRKRKR